MNVPRLSKILNIPIFLNSESAAVLQSRSGSHPSVSVSCLVCGKGQATERCWDITRLRIADRKQKIQQSGPCFMCLEKGHLARGGLQKCSKCKVRHHFLLCGLDTTSDGNHGNNNCSAI